MPRIDVPLTRSSLLEAQAALADARQGFELLDRKREVLIAELVSTVQVAEERRAALDRAIATAYAALIAARMAMGVERVRWAALAVPREAAVHITERSVMGAAVPDVELATAPVRPRYSLAGTTAELDRASEAFRSLAAAVAAVAETETAVTRLSSEIKKTQRRVNALRTVIIPRYELIIRAVQEALEEGEREAFFRAKMQKRLVGREGTGREAGGSG